MDNFILVEEDYLVEVVASLLESAVEVVIEDIDELEAVIEELETDIEALEIVIDCYEEEIDELIESNYCLEEEIDAMTQYIAKLEKTLFLYEYFS